MDSNSDEFYWMCQAMFRYGGGFVQALARCMQAADARNLQVLLDAFPAYVKTYSERGQEMRSEYPPDQGE